jgi:hypothetical protein
MASRIDILSAKAQGIPVMTDMNTTGTIIGLADMDSPNPQVLIVDQLDSKSWFPISVIKLPMNGENIVSVPGDKLDETVNLKRRYDDPSETADRDALLAMSPRRHLLAAAQIAVVTDVMRTDADVMMREVKAQTHLLFAVAKYLDDAERRVTRKP